MKEIATRMLGAYGSAIILMFFSEFFFLNESPVQTLISSLKAEPFFVIFELAEFSLYYTLFTYPFLILLSAYHVRSLSGLLLAGAVFGWLTEAVIVPVVYEAIPISFIFPSVSWHALIDVMLGWYLVRLVMRRRGIVANAAMFAALGAVWGSWATWFWSETEEIARILPSDFAMVAFTASAFWLAGMLISDRSGRTDFAATKWEIAVVGLVTVVLFAGMALPFLPFSLALLPVIGLTIYALYLSRHAQKGTRILGRLYSRRPPWHSYPAVLLTPLTASLLYPWFYKNQYQIPVDLIVPALLILGAIGFLYALIRTFWQGIRAASSNA